MTDLALERARGLHAQQLLDDPLLTETFQAIEASITSEWRSCSDRERREVLWLELSALSRVRGKLKEYAVTGRMAQQQLAAQQ